MNNPLAFVQAMRNPEAFMKKAMENSAIMNNPIARNAIEMYQKGDKEGLNELANNLCREINIEPEKAFDQVKSMLGM